MRGHCSARGQIGTGTVRAALAGPAWALHSIVGWVTHNTILALLYLKGKKFLWRPLHSSLSKLIVRCYKIVIRTFGPYDSQLFITKPIAFIKLVNEAVFANLRGAPAEVLRRTRAPRLPVWETLVYWEGTIPVTHRYKITYSLTNPSCCIFRIKVWQ